PARCARVRPPSVMIAVPAFTVLDSGACPSRMMRWDRRHSSGLSASAASTACSRQRQGERARVAVRYQVLKSIRTDSRQRAAGTIDQAPGCRHRPPGAASPTSGLAIFDLPRSTGRQEHLMSADPDRALLATSLAFAGAAVLGSAVAIREDLPGQPCGISIPLSVPVGLLV